MKILVISTPVFRLVGGSGGIIGYGGLESVAYQCAVGLAVKGHQVSIAAPDGSVVPGCTVIPIGPERQVDEMMAFKKYEALLPTFDAVIDHSWLKPAYLVKGRGTLPKTPVVGVLHAPVDTMFRTLPPGVDKPCFVCISQDQKSHFEALHGREARFVYNAVDAQNFYRPLGLPRTDRFLFLARFSSVKSPAVNMQACINAGANLDLVGDTSITNEPEYFESCRRMADGKQIKIVGGVSRGEAVSWFSRAFAFCHVTPAFREPFGLAVVEAQACGLPAVVFKYGAVKETVIHGVTGWHCTSLDEAVNVIKTWKDEGIPDSVREACRENALSFSLDRMVSGYEALCTEAVEAGGW